VAYIVAGPWPECRKDREFTQPRLAKAQRLFCLFHRFPPPVMTRLRCQRMMPNVLVHLGYLRGLIYSSDKGDRGLHRTYIHFMETPPRLACDAEGSQLYILGGRYRITPRGIEG
jgi:hypothetical protein